MPAYSTNIYVYMGVFAAGPNIYFKRSKNFIFRKYKQTRKFNSYSAHATSIDGCSTMVFMVLIFWLNPLANKKYHYYSENTHHINNKCVLVVQVFKKPQPGKGNKIFINVDLKITLINLLPQLTYMFTWMYLKVV